MSLLYFLTLFGMSFAVLFTLFQATFRCKGTKKKLYVQAIWQKSVFLYVHLEK